MARVLARCLSPLPFVLMLEFCLPIVANDDCGECHEDQKKEKDTEDTNCRFPGSFFLALSSFNFGAARQNGREHQGKYKPDGNNWSPGDAHEHWAAWANPNASGKNEREENKKEKDHGHADADPGIRINLVRLLLDRNRSARETITMRAIPAEGNQ